MLEAATTSQAARCAAAALGQAGGGGSSTASGSFICKYSSAEAANLKKLSPVFLPPPAVRPAQAPSRRTAITRCEPGSRRAGGTFTGGVIGSLALSREVRKTARRDGGMR
eukprot:CAMPEP_0174710910 /NCGR_PEP_ID=MMETSP1094-20130205/12388_1 /TAXON_ID=156173 /ORGANISM="Chrysochromulina brevifilum, Strain UTEX LB 985" /LENGTH=109 /DNA_ID=CAMNT_0015909773 /DNA_START=277 /DNA_END=603 /DNA_ORIENTATION=-